MNNKAMFTLTYGLFVASSRAWERDGGCICNTVMQVTSNPNKISVTLNKDNLTSYMIKDCGEFNISVLDESAPFSVFVNFGFQSGRDVDKYEKINYSRAANGIPYLTENVCSYISAKVVNTVDNGTHYTFIGEVTDMELLGGTSPVTYNYYQKHIKPQPKAEKKKGYRCTICNYLYEGESLPSDFVCPICHHTAEVFEEIK